MKWGKIVKALLFPHIAIMLVLLPVATVSLVYSMVFFSSASPVSVVSYALSAYTLTVWCLKTPYLIRFFKSFKAENTYARLWQDDARLRVSVSLYGSLLINTAYAVFQLGLGFYHSSYWYFSMAGYYITLAVMRFFLVRHTRRHRPGEQMRKELVGYRACGAVFLVMNLAVSLMIFFMIYHGRTFVHHEITTIAMAAYTFTSFTVATVNVIRYGKYNSPVYSASKIISLAAACVSMLTLESTMFTTFDNGTMDALTRKIMLGASGAAVSAFIISMAVYMIVHGSRKIKLLSNSKE